jgi:uncharacterized RDD family membrane protein YckC
MNGGATGEAAGIGRRLMALLYECLLVLAVVFCSAFAFQGATTSMLAGSARHLFQLYLFLVAGLYFVACWANGGQTVAMKAWGLKLVSARGTALSPGRSLARYVLAWLSVATAGAGFLWAVFDRDRQFLHDRLAGTRIVDARGLAAAGAISSPRTTS